MRGTEPPRISTGSGTSPDGEARKRYTGYGQTWSDGKATVKDPKSTINCPAIKRVAETATRSVTQATSVPRPVENPRPPLCSHRVTPSHGPLWDREPASRDPIRIRLTSDRVRRSTASAAEHEVRTTVPANHRGVAR